MKLSTKTRIELYRAIHNTITNLRVQLKLSPRDDIQLAQIELDIWKKQKEVLGLVIK